MPWFKVDDTLHSHPKARRAGLEAMGLWALSGTWCMAYKTDGFVPEWQVAGWPRGKALAAKLVAAGLWTKAVQDGEAGWQYHDWADWQPLAEEVEKEREQARERQREFRKRRRDARTEGSRSGLRSA